MKEDNKINDIFGIARAWKDGSVSRILLKSICEENNCNITFHSDGSVSILVI